MPDLFAYGTLNVHEVQRAIWGEAKEGVFGRLVDYELKLWPNSAIFYVEKKMGEYVPGKMYTLTQEQLEATDKFEGNKYLRRFVFKDKLDEESFWVYVKAEKSPSTPKPNTPKKKGKKGKKGSKK